MEKQPKKKGASKSKAGKFVIERDVSILKGATKTLFKTNFYFRMTTRQELAPLKPMTMTTLCKYPSLHRLCKAAIIGAASSGMLIPILLSQ